MPPGSSSRLLAYSYLRMSTELQLKGDSRRRQLEASKAYAEEHNLDLVDDAQLEDIGISAFKGANIKEGALGRFLEVVKAGSVKPGSYLLVESLDRLSRQEVMKSLTIFLSIIEAGINLVTLDDRRVYSTGKTEVVDLITSLVIMSRAHDESVTKSLRISAAWKNKRSLAASRPMTAMCPAWLRLSSDRSKYEVLEERAEVVRSMFRDAAGGIGMFSIARRLNDRQVPTFTESNGWHMSYVAKILDNRAVIGEFQPHRRVEGVRTPDGDLVKDYFPAVVDEGLFYRAQFGRSERRLSGRGRKGTFVTNLFSGLAKCAYCKSAMKFENKGPGPKGGHYLICDRAKRLLGCPNVRWRYEEFEGSFLAFVRELDLDSVLVARSDLSNREQLDDELSALRGEVSSLNDLMEKTYELLATGSAVEFVADKLTELDGRRKTLESRILVKERERQAIGARTNGIYESKTQIQDLLLRLQNPNSDDEYKLRAEIASKLKSLIDTLAIASLGDIPRIKKTIDLLLQEADDSAANVVAHLKRSLSDPRQHRSFFAVGFKDGTVRVVYPNPNDPLSFEEQVHDTGLELLRLTPESEELVSWKSAALGLASESSDSKKD